MISWDNDVDLAAWFEPLVEEYPKISKEFLELGYDVYITDTKFTLKKDGEHISVYLYKQGIIPNHIQRYRISKKNYMAHILLYGFLEGLKTLHKDHIQKTTPKSKFITMGKHFMRILPSKENLNDLLIEFGKKIGSIIALVCPVSQYN